MKDTLRTSYMETKKDMQKLSQLFITNILTDIDFSCKSEVLTTVEQTIDKEM
jgi:hypothetical protein